MKDAIHFIASLVVGAILIAGLVIFLASFTAEPIVAFSSAIPL